MASSVEPGVGERCVGDALPIGGTRLYSPASRLLNVVDFLACFQGMVVRSTPPLWSWGLGEQRVGGHVGDALGGCICTHQCRDY